MDRQLPVFDFSMPGSSQLSPADFAWNTSTDPELNQALNLTSMTSNFGTSPGSFDAWSLPTLQDTQRSGLPFEALWPNRQQASSLRQEAAPATTLPVASVTDTPSLAPRDSGSQGASNPDSGASKRPGSPIHNARSNDSSEKAKAINRESQRRFRLRAKLSTHSHGIPNALSWGTPFTTLMSTLRLPSTHYLTHSLLPVWVSYLEFVCRHARKLWSISLKAPLQSCGSSNSGSINWKSEICCLRRCPRSTRRTVLHRGRQRCSLQCNRLEAGTCSASMLYTWTCSRCQRRRHAFELQSCHNPATVLQSITSNVGSSYHQGAVLHTPCVHSCVGNSCKAALPLSPAAGHKTQLMPNKQ